jgi:hypothetical protein
MAHQANYTLTLLRCLRACAGDIRRQLDRLEAHLTITQGGAGCGAAPVPGDKSPREDVPFNGKG